MSDGGSKRRRATLCGDDKQGWGQHSLKACNVSQNPTRASLHRTAKWICSKIDKRHELLCLSQISLVLCTVCNESIISYQGPSRHHTSSPPQMTVGGAASPHNDTGRLWWVCVSKACCMRAFTVSSSATRDATHKGAWMRRSSLMVATKHGERSGIVCRVHPQTTQARYSRYSGKARNEHTIVLQVVYFAHPITEKQRSYCDEKRLIACSGTAFILLRSSASRQLPKTSTQP